MSTYSIRNFGPIKDVNVELGDLTILIGPQASGKTLFLEMLKLIIDKDHILSTLNRYNYVTAKSVDNVLNCYFGEGLSSLWQAETKVSEDGHEYRKQHFNTLTDQEATERLFYIPAQRILSISDGRPKNFMEFDISTPYILRNFSENLRLFFQNGMGEEHTIFPVPYRLKGALKQEFNKNIFHDGKVVIDERYGQKKMRMEIDNVSLPFMAWSAGQKEFMPLLMAFYCLSGPQQERKREQYDYIVLEEPEMGLHPAAIQTIILQMLEYMHNGYKVILSTHSTVLLEFAWTFQLLKELPREVLAKALKELFRIPAKQAKTTQSIFNSMKEKTITAYYFARRHDGVKSIDISNLDTSSENLDVAEWGGISQFATRASDVVSSYLSQYGE